MTFLRVAIFSLAVLLIYTAIANLLPQVRTKVEVDDQPKPDTLDRGGQIAWGKRIFTGKGTCTLCHNDLGRAPNLLALDLKQEFSTQISSPRYNGAAKGKTGAEAIEAYVWQKLHEPSAYVVAGFGKKGTNDTVSPMPVVTAPPISLSDDEVRAVIAFFQDRAGVEVTVPLPSVSTKQMKTEKTTEKTGEKTSDEDAPAKTAKEVIEKFGCAGCHDLFGSGAEIGPKLADVGSRFDRDGLRRKILDPNAQIPKGYAPNIMPLDFGQRMRASELELLVDYLSQLRSTKKVEK